MSQTVLFIGLERESATVNELKRRVELIFRGRRSVETLLVKPKRGGVIGEPDLKPIERRMEKRNAPLPVVIWSPDPVDGRQGIMPGYLEDLERAVVLFLDATGSMLRVQSFAKQVQRLPSLADEAAWVKTAETLAEAIQQTLMNPLQSIVINAFGPFKRLKVSFCSGINVLVGANSTGKSWLMKLLYGALRASKDEGDGLQIESRLKQRLARLYRPDQGRVGRLVTRGKGRGRAIVEINQSGGSLRFSVSTRDNIDVDQTLAWAGLDALDPGTPVFLPSREALAFYEGFISTYNGRELAIDETMFDLCVALSAAPLRGPRSGFAKSTLDELERTLGGSIRLKDNRFYLVSNDGQGDLESHLLSEGLRKVGTLAQLIANGTLQRGSILFWDEPEANLNPRLIVQMAEVLRQLAALGVQVFLATHDYLLTQRLSMEVEYKQTKVPLRFISLYRDDEGEICADQANTLVGLSHNDIQDEHRLLYEHELRLAASFDQWGDA